MSQEKAQEGRQDLEKGLRDLLESLPAVLWEADAATWRFTDVGPEAAKLLGYPIEQWFEENFWADHLHPKDRGSTVESRRNAVARGQDHQLEYPMVAADGRILWIHEIARVVYRAGAPRGLQGLMIDVTDQRETQCRLCDAQVIDALIESLPGLFFMTDMEGRFLRWNRNREVLTGFSAEEISRMRLRDMIAPEDRERVLQGFEAAIRKGSGRSEHHLLTRDGRRVPVLAQGAVVQIRGEKYAVGMAIEVTALKQREEELRRALAEVEELKSRLAMDNVYLRQEIQLNHRHEEVVGDSEAIKRVLSQVEQVAGTSAAVLLLGETGVGKELIARAIHRLSPRGERPLVKVNCAALPSTLIESELFGRERGAYTGALTRQAGRFEVADGSTIFLDEVGDLPPELQAKLLRVLQDGEFERLGSTRTTKVDVRVIAATNRDLATAVREGKFREDLYYRLNVFPISIPPLRERREDVPLLVWVFIREFGETMGKAIETVSKKTVEALKTYAWPGNVRELRNVIERAMIVSPGPALLVDVPSLAERTPPDEAARLEDVEHRHILATLEKTGWRVRGPQGAASRLGLKPTTLEARMQKLGIKRAQSPPRD